MVPESTAERMVTMPKPYPKEFREDHVAPWRIQLRRQLSEIPRSPAICDTGFSRIRANSTAR